MSLAMLRQAPDVLDPPCVDSTGMFWNEPAVTGLGMNVFLCISSGLVDILV